MLRLRVYRLALPITILGLELWALGVIGLGGLLSLEFYQQVLPAWLAFPASGVTGYLLMRLVAFIKIVFPGRALAHTFLWLSQGDRYVIQREIRPLPLIVPERDRYLVRRSAGVARPSPTRSPQPIQTATD